MTDKKQARVVVGMSGGVDSSVTAALLLHQGYDVVGVMLRLWSASGKDEANRCCTPDAMAQARRVAAQLGIPFYVIDAREVFRQTIVERFAADYRAGVTPNPCLRCNEFIRWGFLLERAMALEADYFATGHYARVKASENGIASLLRGVDTSKDQSYVLSVLNQDQLKRTLLPVGEYTKDQVRQMAREWNLAVADRPDSQYLCFLAGEDYRSFLKSYAPQSPAPGPIVNRQGELLGEHPGLLNYTIGQRKGLGVPSSVPMYVIEKRMHENALVIGTRDELGRNHLRAGQAHWISGEPPTEPFAGVVKIRYQAKEARGIISPFPGDRFQVEFEENLRDITPGQAAVIYNGEVCLGCGIIED